MNSRRQFLSNCALAATAASLNIVPRLSSAAPLSAAKRLDIVEGFVSPTWSQAMHAISASTQGDAAFWTAWQTNSLQLQRHSMSDNHALTLLSLPAPGVEPFAAEMARALATQLNDELAAVVHASQGHIAGLATVSAFDAKAAQEAERAIAQGLSGISLAANRGMSLQQRSLWPLYEFAAHARVPVYLPAAYAPIAGDTPYRAMGRAGVVAGAAADSARHVTQLIFGGVLDTFPTLKVVMARMGEGLPYWYGQLTDTHAALTQAGQAPQRNIEAYFASNVLLTSADMSAATLRFCNVMFDAQRLLMSPGSIDAAHIHPDMQQLASGLTMPPTALWA